MRKTIKHSNYTFTKRGIYYFSKRIPQDIQSHYQQSRIVHSLKKKDKNQAHSAAGTRCLGSTGFRRMLG